MFYRTFVLFILEGVTQCINTDVDKLSICRRGDSSIQTEEQLQERIRTQRYHQITDGAHFSDQLHQG